MAAHLKAVNWSAPAPSRWFISKQLRALKPCAPSTRSRGAFVHADVDRPHRVRQAAPCPMQPTPCTRCGPLSSALCQGASIALGCPAAPRRFPSRSIMLCGHRSSHSLLWRPGVLIACKALTSSCARARRFDGPPPLVRAAEPAPDPERGGPMRGDRPNAAADSLIRSSRGGNWHAVAGRVQPIRRRPLREAVPPRAASAALHGREASAPCRQCCVAADHDRGEGRPPCGDRPNNGGSRPHRPCALVFSGRACSVA